MRTESVELVVNTPLTRRKPRGVKDKLCSKNCIGRQKCDSDHFHVVRRIGCPVIGREHFVVTAKQPDPHSEAPRDPGSATQNFMFVSREG